MTRDDAIARATAHFDAGGFLALLREAVSIPTESQRPDHAGQLDAYLKDFIVPLVAKLGFRTRRSCRTRTARTGRS